MSRLDTDFVKTGVLEFTQEIVSPAAWIDESMLKANTAIPRGKLAQENLQPYALDFSRWRIFDAMQTVLPGTAAGDDLAFEGGTFATSSPIVTAGDVKTLSSTRYARFLVQLPLEYRDGETVQLRFYAGMLTTPADGSCDLDVEVYEADGEGGIGSDLYTGAALDINSVTFANKDFNLTPGGLAAGDWLDVRVAIIYADSATGTEVKPTIGKAFLLADIKG